MVQHQVAVVVEVAASKVVLQSMAAEELLLVDRRCVVFHADLAQVSVVRVLQVLLELHEAREESVALLATRHWAFQGVHLVADLLDLPVQEVDAFRYELKFTSFCGYSLMSTVPKSIGTSVIIISFRFSCLLH